MNVVFWLLAAAMTVAATTVVVWPLWRHDPRRASRREANITIYRERVMELRAEVAAGRVPAEEAASMEAELGRRLLTEADDPGEEPGPPGTARRPWVITLLLAAVLPGLAFSLYLSGGEWRLAGSGPPPMPVLVDRLEARVATEPDDARAWLFLGRAYEAQENFAEAARAYRRVNELMVEPDMQVTIREAESLAMASGGRLTARAVELFRRVLSEQPDNGVALWYVGLAAAQAGDEDAARRYWTRLEKQDLPPDFREVLERSIDELGMPR